jgi:hypothetical protein
MSALWNQATMSRRKKRRRVAALQILRVFGRLTEPWLHRPACASPIRKPRLALLYFGDGLRLGDGLGLSEG